MLPHSLRLQTGGTFNLSHGAERLQAAVEQWKCLPNLTQRKIAPALNQDAPFGQLTLELSEEELTRYGFPETVRGSGSEQHQLIASCVSARYKWCGNSGGKHEGLLCIIE